MGNDDDGAAFVAHLAQYGEQALNFLWRQHRCGLVEHQRARPAIEHLENLHRLLFADGERIDLARGVDVQAKAVAQIRNFPVELFAVGIVPGSPQDDVFLHGKHVHELEMLMNHTDAQRDGVVRGADMHFLAVYADMARVRAVNAGEHVHQRGLAGAVFTQQGQDFAAEYSQVNILIGDN